MDESEDYDISLNAEVCEQISAEDTMDATVGDAGEANIVEEYVGDRSDDKGSYEAYKKMTPLEKAQTYGFGELKSYDTVRSIVQMKFLDMGHIADVDEIMEETDLLYKGMYELVVKNKTEEVLDEIKQRGIAFDDLSVIEKARMLQFQPDNNSYNIQLYSAVCKACGVDTSDEDKLIAETLQNLKYVQRTGQGVDIIFKDMVLMGKPYPRYRSFNDAVSLTIFRKKKLLFI